MAKVCVARELTKKFERISRRQLAELLAHFQTRRPKGELTLVISPGHPGTSDEQNAPGE